MDDSIEANVSTFASEMRETAFILRYVVHPVAFNYQDDVLNCDSAEILIGIVSLSSMSLAEVLVPEMGLLSR
jgi:hypothetical protein